MIPGTTRALVEEVRLDRPLPTRAYFLSHQGREKLNRISEVFASPPGDDPEPLSDDAREAIREGLSHSRPPGYEQDMYGLDVKLDDDGPGLPPGWTMDGVVEP